MNTPNNKRRRESVRAMEKVFVELLQSRELNQITVSDLCKGAGLNRSTFYANYLDIYDLADHVRAHLERDVFELYREDVEQKNNSNDYLRLFRHIQKNQIFYRTYFKLGYDRQHQVKVYDTRQAEVYFDNRLIKYHIEFFKSGLNAIIKLWLDGGCRETPEEMEEVIRGEYQGRTQEI